MDTLGQMSLEQMKAQVTAMARHRYETGQVPTKSAVGYTGDYGKGSTSVLEKAVASRNVAIKPAGAAVVQNRPTETPRYVGQGSGPVAQPTETPRYVGQGSGPVAQPTETPRYVGQGSGPVAQPTSTPRYVGQGAGVGLAKPVAAATHEIEEPKSGIGTLIVGAVALGAMLL